MNNVFEQTPSVMSASTQAEESIKSKAWLEDNEDDNEDDELGLDQVARGILSPWTENPFGNDQNQPCEEIVNDCLSHARNAYPETDHEIESVGGEVEVRYRMECILGNEWGIG